MTDDDSETGSAEDSAWDLVTAFFEARRLFLGQYETYESTVLGLASQRGVDRSQLKLPAKEVAQLLDFERLDMLYEERLVPLVELSRTVLRDGDRTTLFDRLVTDVFHEIAILREEHFEVVEHGEVVEAEGFDREVSQVLAEVHEYFPKRLHRVQRLFAKAQDRLEAFVCAYKDNKVFVRSLYLFGERTWPDSARREQFYRCVFDGGIAEGMLAAAESFAASGFEALASDALGRARAYLDAGKPIDPEQREALRARLDRVVDALCATP